MKLLADKSPTKQTAEYSFWKRCMWIVFGVVSCGLGFLLYKKGSDSFVDGFIEGFDGNPPMRKNTKNHWVEKMTIRDYKAND